MKIYLIRHGTTDECQKNMKQSLDSSLNNQGIEQIKKINVKTDIIYVSPSRRTIESAKLINPNARVIVDNRLYNKKRDLEHYSNELHSFLDEIREINYDEVMIVTHGRIIKMIYSILEFDFIDTNFTDALSMEYGSISTIENNKMVLFNQFQ